MNLEITTRIGCANNCVYCPQPTLAKAYQKRSNVYVMSLHTFKSCIDKVPKNVTIDFSGMCEPWLNKDCTNMVMYARKKGHEIRIFTTLIGMTPEDARILATFTYPRAWGFVIHVPAAEKGLEHIPVTPRYLEVLRILLASGLHLQFHTHGKKAHPEVEKIVGSPIRSVRPNSISGHISNSYVYPKPSRKRGILWCSRIYQNVLLPNGDVVLCCQDYGMDHTIGNLLTDSYADLHRSDEFKRIIRGFKDEKENILCRYCHFSRNVDAVAKRWNVELQNIELP